MSTWMHHFWLICVICGKAAGSKLDILKHIKAEHNPALWPGIDVEAELIFQREMLLSYESKGASKSESKRPQSG